MSRLSASSGKSGPPFLRIADDLRRQIIGGRWAVGDSLPSRRDLAVQYEVTPNTINRAVLQLMEQGLVGANDRQGTFVTAATISDQAVESLPASAAPVVTPSAARDRPAWRIGVVVAEDDAGGDPWTSIVSESCERALSAAGVATRVYPVYWGKDAVSNPGAAVDLARRDRVDALIFLDVHNHPGWDEAAAAIDWKVLPTVYVAGVSMGAPFPQVSHDQRHAGFIAARHLAEAGYRRLVFLQPCSATWVDERIKGARLGTRMAGVSEVEFQVYPVEASRTYDEFRHAEDASATIARLVDEVVAGSWTGETAVICHADREAQAVIEHLLTLKRMPGRDLGVIGFDDAPGGRKIGLSSVRPPLEAMGERAARTVLAGLASGFEPVQTCLSPVVIQRISTSRA